MGGKINMAMMAAICKFFWDKTPDFLHKNRMRIVSNFKKLLSNKDFKKTVMSSTGHIKSIKKRFELVYQIGGDL